MKLYDVIIVDVRDVGTMDDHGNPTHRTTIASTETMWLAYDALSECLTGPNGYHVIRWSIERDGEVLDELLVSEKMVRRRKKNEIINRFKKNETPVKKTPTSCLECGGPVDNQTRHCDRCETERDNTL